MDYQLGPRVFIVHDANTLAAYLVDIIDDDIAAIQEGVALKMVLTNVRRNDTSVTSYTAEVVSAEPVGKVSSGLQRKMHVHDICRGHCLCGVYGVMNIRAKIGRAPPSVILTTSGKRFCLFADEFNTFELGFHDTGNVRVQFWNLQVVPPEYLLGSLIFASGADSVADLYLCSEQNVCCVRRRADTSYA